MGTPRRVGFVGAGDLAPVHVEAVQALTGVLAVGVHDIEAPRATSLADRYGLRAVATLEELVGLGVDVVHVITPPETHAELAIRAMELGCDVFIEKPMALSVEDCERVVATSRRTGRTATVDHLMLFNPQVRRAVELVRARHDRPGGGGGRPARGRDPGVPGRDPSALLPARRPPVPGPGDPLPDRDRGVPRSDHRRPRVVAEPRGRAVDRLRRVACDGHLPRRPRAVPAELERAPAPTRRRRAGDVGRADARSVLAHHDAAAVDAGTTTGRACAELGGRVPHRAGPDHRRLPRLRHRPGAAAAGRA